MTTYTVIQVLAVSPGRKEAASLQHLSGVTFESPLLNINTELDFILGVETSNRFNNAVTPGCRVAGGVVNNGEVVIVTLFEKE